jgi:hypothetical protein
LGKKKSLAQTSQCLRQNVWHKTANHSGKGQQNPSLSAKSVSPSINLPLVAQTLALVLARDLSDLG